MNYELSYWGVTLILVLWVLAVALFVLIDRREMRRILKVTGVMAAQMMVVGGGVWAVYKVNTWWMNALWLLVMAALAAGWCLRSLWKEKSGNAGKQMGTMALAVVAGLLAGCLVAGGSMVLTLPEGCVGGSETASHTMCFVPAMGVLLACLSLSVTLTLQTYQRCLLHTEAHRQYMLANGATRLESLMPCIRRALRAAIQPLLRTMARPLLVAMPLLFAGMLLGGVSPVGAAVVTVLFAAAAFVGSVVAAVAALATLAYLTDSR